MKYLKEQLFVNINNCFTGGACHDLVILILNVFKRNNNNNKVFLKWLLSTLINFIKLRTNKKKLWSDLSCCNFNFDWGVTDPL